MCTKCMGVGSVGFYYRIGGKGQVTASRWKDRSDLLIVKYYCLCIQKRESWVVYEDEIINLIVIVK